MNMEQMAALVAPALKGLIAPVKAGLDALTKTVGDLRVEISKAWDHLTALNERLQKVESEKSIPGADGKDGAPGADGQKGVDGRDGIDGQPGERGEKGDAGPQGERGPAGQDGAPGEKGEPGERGPQGEKGIDGTNGRDGERGADGLAGEKGLDGRDGRDGKDGSAGRDALQIDVLPAIQVERSYSKGTYASHEGGLWYALRTTVGMDGWTCIVDGIKALNVVPDESDPRVFRVDVAHTSGVKAHWHLHMPVMIYRGVFKEGTDYQHGDTVTWGGSLWHCEEDTDTKPDAVGSKAWVLCAKRGRDGKDARP